MIQLLSGTSHDLRREGSDPKPILSVDQVRSSIDWQCDNGIMWKTLLCAHVSYEMSAFNL